MAESTHNATSIPQYLRYKADVAEIDETERSEAKLEKANMIVHERLLRMHRDKLCAGCSRFDFKRTRMYSRDVSVCYLDRDERIWKDYEDVEEDTWGENYLRLNVKDIVPWHIYETVPEAPEEAKLLADHPKLKWIMDLNGSPTCTFCDTLRRCFMQSKRHLNSSAGLVAFIVMHGEGIQKHEYREIHFNGNLPTNALCLWVHWGEAGRFVVNFRPAADMPTVRPKIKPDAQMFRSISIRNVESTVDFDLCLSYLQKCDHNHHHDQKDMFWQELSDLRYIDIDGSCVVKKASKVKYAALSYTWLSAKQLCLTQQNTTLLEKRNSLQRLHDGSDHTLLDLIKVCKKLNIPYAWVDRLCIIQDEPESKRRQIRNMDQIYANAYITLISAPYGHQHTNSSLPQAAPISGLPRVSSPIISNQLSLNIEGINYSIVPENLRDRLANIMEKSDWFTRGWTFQELALSTRILVFTLEETFFYCPEGLRTESLCAEDDLNFVFPLEPESSISLCGYLHKPLPESPTEKISTLQWEARYLHLLRMYMSRTLTYDNDALNAFSGILTLLSKFLGKFHWGLPWDCLLGP